ncbi:isoprenyl transferase [Vineibacter terrae]|uniref:Isoprenyl transferase n=1 Tax=Vineibacter terrae TaxID=2586908 RepID=A0A5C8PPS3_9HYPH|nr:isoprenyl transferase [Vineibacter terrae]TXL76720.1 isoprenyl transferase [Vineibacter terrae]
MSTLAAPIPMPAGMPEGPRHVAIIMDGNGRWAKARGMPRTAGHRRGVETVRATVRAAGELGIEYLTLFGFSTENWKRPLDEVNFLMGLLRQYLRAELETLAKEGARLRVVGDRDGLAADIVDMIKTAEERTRANARIHVSIALNYGGRADIVQAAQRLATAVAQGKLAPAAIDEDMLEGCLLTRDLPELDMLIRTGGEQRISNFLLWQSAYTELVFTNALWPDFSKADLEHAIAEFRRRERRYGAVAG